MVRSVLDLDLRDLGAWQGPVERLERLERLERMERMERMEGFRASALRSEAWQAAKTNAPSCRSRRSTSFPPRFMFHSFHLSEIWSFGNGTSMAQAVH